MGLFDIFSNNNAQDAANAQTAGLNKGYGQLSDQFNQGRQALQTNYGAALQPFQQNYQAAQGGQQAYGDATGANGQVGFDRAVGQFHTSPGYQFSLDQGSENVMRNAARTGSLASGGTQIDLQKLAQGAADQQWQSYVGNLLPYIGAANSAAGGVAGVNTGLGNQLNASQMTQGNAAYGTQAGIGNAQASADLAKNNGLANLWGLGMNVAKLGTNTVGGGLLSNVGSTIGSFFS
jgi:hypothetical protein